MNYNTLSDDEWDKLPSHQAMKTRMTDKERFWSNVYKWGDNCWLWSGAYYMNRNRPEPKFSYKGKTIAAYRASYILFIGDIPDTYHVHHKCKNHFCIRPDHLEVVSRDDHKYIHDPRNPVNVKHYTKEMYWTEREDREVEWQEKSFGVNYYIESKKGKNHPDYIPYGQIAVRTHKNGWIETRGEMMIGLIVSRRKWQTCPLCTDRPFTVGMRYWGDPRDDIYRRVGEISGKEEGKSTES